MRSTHRLCPSANLPARLLLTLMRHQIRPDKPHILTAQHRLRRYRVYTRQSESWGVLTAREMHHGGASTIRARTHDSRQPFEDPSDTVPHVDLLSSGWPRPGVPHALPGSLSFSTVNGCLGHGGSVQRGFMCTQGVHAQILGVHHEPPRSELL
ncbi:hypothetical protein SMALB_5082 [Streptomyces malaysiensis]|uniref:Uncharacterized protein n=1 Tax=Streptomyces malaysiensis TaxID=92644 RepID=A0A7X6AZB0_STRMQ|nr:hypothetical protein [Streptomyces malaysiensis]